ncbi:cupin domain-containing protein [Rhodococcoides corynebacterioides]|uniref:cupin domain-containing protein n=1 Tax=Rhodococcoides corynebacterioides TaxID=53972 RepID=UPI00353006C6
MSLQHDEQRGPDHRSALSRLTTLDRRAFADRHWGREPLLTRAADLPSSFDDLLTADAVDELISERGVRTPFVRMAKDGALTDRSRYTGSGGFGAEVTDQLDSAGVLAAFAEGHTLVLQGLHRLWPSIIRFSGDLVEEIGHPVQVNSYITPASSRGFDPHHDVHDVFVLQIAGEKRWILHPPVHEHPLADQPWTDHRAAVGARAAETPTLDTVLRPGDALYVPRGWIHSAEALGATSIHLTVGMSALTRHDLLRQVVAALADDATFRAPLPLGFDPTDPDAVAPHVQSLLSDLAAAAGDPDPSLTASVADRVGRRFADVTRPAPVRPLATIDALATLGAATLVRRRPGLVLTTDTESDRVHVRTRRTTISLPVECAPALDAVLGGKVLAVADLPGLTVEDAVVVVRRLVREGVFVIESA